MTTYEEVAGALVSAGYLSDADADAAVAVLTDALIVEEAEDAEAAAMEDYSAQEDLIAEAEVWEREDAASGDIYATEDDARIITAAADQMAVDEETVIEAEAVINAAYTDAAAALLAAQLIDEANREAVAAAIADVWVVEEE